MTIDAAAVELRGAVLRTPSVRLGPLDLSIAGRGVTVVLGPVATGKSTLLSALAGCLEAEWTLEGSWSVRGEDVAARLRDRAELPGIHLRRQVPRGPMHATASAESFVADIPAASILLLDEPERQVHPDEIDSLAQWLRVQGRTRAVVVVTHDVAFARTVADEVVLLAAGAVVAQGAAPGFFEPPRPAIVETFLRQGNCWPVASYQPRLPAHFHWVLPQRLAGMAYPGLLGDEEEELEAIARAGVEILVSTTHDPFARDRLRAFGIEGRHLPIKDMGVPAERNVATLCSGLDRAFAADRAVAIHCKAGLGRTGLVLASILAWRGTPGAESIAAVRAVEPKYIQTQGQERFVLQFAESIGAG